MVDIIFDNLIEYMEYLAGWYPREVNGDLSLATKQIDNPPWLEGVSDWYRRLSSDSE